MVCPVFTYHRRFRGNGIDRQAPFDGPDVVRGDAFCRDGKGVDVSYHGRQFRNGTGPPESAEGVAAAGADRDAVPPGPHGPVRNACHLAVETVKFRHAAAVDSVEITHTLQVPQPFFPCIDDEEDSRAGGLEPARQDVFEVQEQRDQVGRIVSDAGTEEARVILAQGQALRVGKDDIRVGREDDQGIVALVPDGIDQIAGLVDEGRPGAPAFQQGLAEANSFFLLAGWGRNPRQDPEQVQGEGGVGLDKSGGIGCQHLSIRVSFLKKSRTGLGPTRIREGKTARRAGSCL